MANSGKDIIRYATPDIADEKVIQGYTDGAKHVTLIDSEGNSQVFTILGDSLLMRDTQAVDLLKSISIDLKINNAYLKSIVGEKLTEHDIEGR